MHRRSPWCSKPFDESEGAFAYGWEFDEYERVLRAGAAHPAFGVNVGEPSGGSSVFSVVSSSGETTTASSPRKAGRTPYL